METVVAKLSKTWKNRQLMIAGFLAAFALWFIYDGAIGWPAKNEQHAAHEKMKEEGRVAEWPDYSRKQGWPLKPPDHAYDADQIRQQFYLAGFALAGSGVALALLVVCLPRTMRADDDAAYSPKGLRVPFSNVTAVDKKKWDSKGIAIAHYRENGDSKKLVIDDYKYQGADEILKRIEEHLGNQSPSAGSAESAPVS